MLNKLANFKTKIKSKTCNLLRSNKIKRNFNKTKQKRKENKLIQNLKTLPNNLNKFKNLQKLELKLKYTFFNFLLL